MRDRDQELDQRLQTALQAMRDAGPPASDSAQHLAARAILAGARPVASPAWGLRAAAVAIVAIGGTLAVQRALETRAPSSAPIAAAAPAEAAAPLIPVVRGGARPIVFDFEAPTAESVQLLGDFNGWSRESTQMERTPDGHWRATTMLPPGRYVYAFLVDGHEFRVDPHRDRVEDRDFGIAGSELVVSESP
jgi:hypothetical protein